MIDQYCCANIAFYGGDEVVQISMSLEDIGTIPTYLFSWDSSDFFIIYNLINQSWELWLDGEPQIMLGFSIPNSLSDLCPESIFGDWFITATGYAQIAKIENSDAFTIYRCDEEVYIPEYGNVDEENCEAYAPCRNKNLLSKSSMALSKDIASLSKREVFGFKCDDAWENIFMRSLIIDALSCLPYGTYSEEEEQCLIGKLTDKCNC